MNKQYKADLALLIVTLSWGLSFILSKTALSALSTFNFLGVRFLIAALLCMIIFYKKLFRLDKSSLKYGAIIGFVMFLAYAIQTIGLNYTTASKSAFISALAVVLVPILSSLLLKKSPKPAAVLGVLLSPIGLALLTLDGNLALNIGDLYTFLCTFCFAFQIILIGKYAQKGDPIIIAITQIFIVGFLSLITSWILEDPILPQTGETWFGILFLSIFCTALAFVVQNLAQKYTSATHTALIFTGEPVFAAVFGYFVAGEVLSTRGILGGLLIVFSMLLAELNLKLPLFRKKFFRYRSTRNS